VGPALIQQGVRFPVGLSTFDPAGQIPTIYSWSIGVQREVTRSMSVDVAYLGNAGRHLQYRRDLNQLDLGTTLQPGVLASVNNAQNALRRYRGYLGIPFTEFGAVSNYKALQARLTRRFAQSLTGNFNYTLSAARGEVDGDGTSIGYYKDRRREYSYSGYDRRQVVTIDFVYELPKFAKDSRAAGIVLNGWQMNGITRFWSGNPGTVTSNGNLGTLGGGQFANYITGSIYPDQQSRRNYINIAAFGRPPDGQLGNTVKNSIRLPGINQWDLSLLKNFRVTEGVNVQFRFETFNTFNHTQWSGVNLGLGLPNPGTAATEATRGSFGEVSGTRDPRSLQFGLKFLF
jgi:hypothetical protein